ncbi:MAG: hypothetical protein ACPF8W_00355 [Luminiphilus sp.]
MTLQSSGAISMSQIRSEFGGGSGAISFSDFYRGGSKVRSKASNNTATNLAASVPTSGAIAFSNFYGQARAFRKTYTATATNQNASSVFGSDYGVNYPKEIVINSGVELGATTTGEEALQINSGLSGGLTITNNGTLSGAGGSAGGGAGGDAFEANVACTLINNGTIRAGGGGGGNGGGGGTGGTGGQGRTSYTYLGSQSQYNINPGYCVQPGGGNNQFYLVSVAYNGGSYGGVAWYNNSQYCSNTYRIDGRSGSGNATINTYARSISFNCVTGNWDSCSYNNNFQWKTVNTGYNYHNGGGGGSGGGGGAGGRGQGYNHGSQNGSGGSAGAGGSAGGTNAGAGGQGGTGGTGGNGGGYGAAGGNGATGATGNTGANGNNGNGSAGTGGSGGSNGGAAGKYIRGLSNITFTNNGTVLGGTA